MVAEETEENLDTPFAERLENLLAMVENVLDLRVAEHIYFAFLPVIVDVGSEEADIIPEIAAVLHPELESIQRVGVIDLEIEERLLLARLPHGGALTGTVLQKIHAAGLGNLDIAPCHDSLERENVSGLGNEFRSVGTGNLHAKPVGYLFIRSDDNPSPVLDGIPFLRPGQEISAVLPVVLSHIVGIIFHLHVHSGLGRTGQCEGHIGTVAVAEHFHDGADIAGIGIPERANERIHIFICTLINSVDYNILGAGNCSKRGNDDSRGQHYSV